MVKNTISIQALQPVHIPFAMELKNIAKWNQTEEDWLSYLEIEKDGCFLAVADTEDHVKEAGTATALSFDGKVGWIGMVLVHPSKRRMGVGTVLLERSIQYLQDNDIPCIKLDATPMGKKVYVPLGFVDEYEVRRYEGRAKLLSEPSNSGRSYTPEKITSNQLKRLAVWDGERFGAKRSKVLEGFWKRAPELCFSVVKEGQIKGYIMAHKGYDAYQIGPFLAEDADAADSLFHQVMQQLEGHPVFLDVPVPNQQAIALMDHYGFSIQRSFCRMFLGENLYPGEPDQVFATSGAEKG